MVCNIFRAVNVTILNHWSITWYSCVLLKVFSVPRHRSPTSCSAKSLFVHFSILLAFSHPLWQHTFGYHGLSFAAEGFGLLFLRYGLSGEPIVSSFLRGFESPTLPGQPLGYPAEIRAITGRRWTVEDSISKTWSACPDLRCSRR